MGCAAAPFPRARGALGAAGAGSTAVPGTGGLFRVVGDLPYTHPPFASYRSPGQASRSAPTATSAGT